MPLAPSLPPPSIYDILPPLYTLLSLLSNSSPSTSLATSPPPTSSPNANPPTQLSPKDLPTATSTIKIKIQRARVATRELPDGERTIKEQEIEIRELEAEVQRLKGVMAGFLATEK